MAKKKVIINSKNITQEILDLIEKQYPYGFEHKVILVPSKNGFFNAIVVETEDYSYLVKLPDEDSYKDSEAIIESLSIDLKEDTSEDFVIEDE